MISHYQVDIMYYWEECAEEWWFSQAFTSGYVVPVCLITGDVAVILQLAVYVDMLTHAYTFLYIYAFLYLSVCIYVYFKISLC